MTVAAIVPEAWPRHPRRLGGDSSRGWRSLRGSALVRAGMRPELLLSGRDRAVIVPVTVQTPRPDLDRHLPALLCGRPTASPQGSWARGAPGRTYSSEPEPAQPDHGDSPPSPRGTASSLVPSGGKRLQDLLREPEVLEGKADTTSPLPRVSRSSRLEVHLVRLIDQGRVVFRTFERRRIPRSGWAHV
jgi:hypothetical protein